MSRYTVSRYTNVLEMVGNTPHLQIALDRPSPSSFFIKLEGANPTGSVKDRACVGIIQEKIKQGHLREGMRLLDASSGNMGCAIAYYGRPMGFPATIISSSKLTQDKKHFMEYFGAEVRQTGDFTIEGNHLCRELAREQPETYCFLDQLHDWANPNAHYEGTGPEILRSFPEVSMVVASLGSGGTLCGSARFLKEKHPQIKIVAVKAAPGTSLPGTGAFDDGDFVTPFITAARQERLFDLEVQISYDEAEEQTLWLRDRGVFAGLQTGGVFRAAVNAAEELGIAGDVVVISGDSGWKNMEKLQAL